MIIDLLSFINALQKQQHEIIVGINTNELNDQPNNRVAKILHLTNLIDVTSQKHGIRKEPNIYFRGSKRISFLFCSEYLSTFIKKCGIVSFNEVTFFDHRGLFIDLYV